MGNAMRASAATAALGLLLLCSVVGVLGAPTKKDDGAAAHPCGDGCAGLLDDAAAFTNQAKPDSKSDARKAEPATKDDDAKAEADAASEEAKADSQKVSRLLGQAAADLEEQAANVQSCASLCDWGCDGDEDKHKAHCAKCAACHHARAVRQKKELEACVKICKPAGCASVKDKDKPACAECAECHHKLHKMPPPTPDQREVVQQLERGELGDSLDSEEQEDESCAGVCGAACKTQADADKPECAKCAACKSS